MKTFRIHILCLVLGSLLTVAFQTIIRAHNESIQTRTLEAVAEAYGYDLVEVQHDVRSVQR